MQFYGSENYIPVVSLSVELTVASLELRHRTTKLAGLVFTIIIGKHSFQLDRDLERKAWVQG